MVSGTPLISVDEVLSRLSEAPAHGPDTETISIADALNRVLSAPVISDISVPPSDNSAVDGYALNAADLGINAELSVSQRIPAGQQPTLLEAGTAARIFTGASVPQCADSVVMQEDVTQLPSGQIRIGTRVQPGQNIRPKGQDIAAGQTLLQTGSVLNPQRMGLIASVGIAHVPVYKPLKVAILSTGDELIEPGQAAMPHQIYNSNRYMLKGLLDALQMDVVDFGVIPDTRPATERALAEAAEGADVVITTGGASVGEEDHIGSSIATLGKVDLWRVAIKPGKPFMFGRIDHTPVLGLPGNPGAVLVTFLILARPLLFQLQGLKDQAQNCGYILPLAFDLKTPGKRREFMRVRRNIEGALERHPNQSSGMLSSASWAEGLAILREGTAYRKGDLVEYLPFSELIGLPY